MTPENEDPRKMTVRQLVAVFMLSLRRLAGSKFMLVTAILGALPVCITILIVFFHRAEFGAAGINTPGYFHGTFDNIVRIFYLHFIIFFVANIFGFAVVRQEVDDQTLHYLFLQPVRRSFLVLGKLFAYLVLASAVCVTSLWLTYLIWPLFMFGPVGLVSDLFVEGRLLVLLRQSVVLVLGLLTYGAIAMAMGSVFKSGLYALLLLGWESGLPYLPSTLKLWTIAHYLHSLLPEPIQTSRKVFELVGEPASILMSLTVPVFLSAVMIGIAILLFQIKECVYGQT